MNQTSDTSKLSLLELQQLIKREVEGQLIRSYWVVAEINELKTNSSGHCYLELVQLDSKTSFIQAKVPATIWAYSYRMIQPFFELATGKQLSEGLKVLVKAKVQYHEVYGLSLNITDIDPSYTVGELELQRQKTIRQLKEEGVFDMNKELEFPLVPQRIAVISSEKAAGYQDFINQLTRNPYGYAFSTKLYSALVQGKDAEKSLLNAIDQVFAEIDRFDVLVVIRGGGSTADLQCFDSYLLASHIAQLPLPVLTGIGHDKDESIVDMVAHTMLKTPTAVAAYLTDAMLTNEHTLNSIAAELAEIATGSLQQEQLYLHQQIANVKTLLTRRIEKEKTHLQFSLQAKLAFAARNLFTEKRHRLSLLENTIDAHNPKHILKLGYAIVERSKQRIKSSSKLAINDMVELHFADGKLRATILDKKIKPNDKENNNI